MLDGRVPVLQVRIRADVVVKKGFQSGFLSREAPRNTLWL